MSPKETVVWIMDSDERERKLRAAGWMFDSSKKHRMRKKKESRIELESDEDDSLSLSDINTASGFPTRDGELWYLKEDIFIEDEFKLGSSIKKIAIKVQRSPNAVKRRLRILGIL